MARIRGGAGVVQDALYPDPIYNNQLQEDSFSDRSYEDLGGVHPPRTHSGLQSIMPHDIPNFREDVDINYSNAYPQPFERPNMLDVSGQVGEYSQRPGQIPYPTSQKTGFQFPNIGITGILQGIKDQFQRPQEMQTAYEAITGSADDEGYGKYKGNEYRIEDTPTGKKIFSELYPHG